MSSEETAKAKETASVIEDEKKVEKSKKPAKEKAERRSKKRFLPIIVAAVGIALIIGVIIFIIHLANSNPNKTVFDTDAVFLPENESPEAKYALFRNNGERLTEFEFTSVGEFVDGYAAVRNADGKYAIIDHNGKISVDYDKYAEIRSFVGFYEVREAKEDESKKLILGNGKEIATDYKSVTYDYSAPFLAIETEEKHYSLYSAKGDRLAEFEGEQPYIDAYNANTVSYARYDEGILLLDNKKLSIMINYLTDNKYSIESATKDSSIIVLRERSSKDSDKYAVYRDGKVTEYGDECKSITLNSDATIGRNYLTCSKDDKTYLIRGATVSDITTNSYDSEYRVYDEDHYVKFDSKEKKATFFVKNEQKGMIDASFAPTISLKGYYVRNSNDKKVYLYSIDGEMLYSLENTSYGDLIGLDKNDNIIVRDPNQPNDERYLLVNRKGETLAEKYSEIRNYGDYYTAKSSANKTVALLDKDGKEIVSGEYLDFSFYNENKIVFARVSSNEYAYIDVANKQEKDHASGYVYYNEHNDTIKISGDEKVVFFAADGKKIHEYSRK